MARFIVNMTVEFSGEIEADSAEEAEQLAIYDQNCMYVGVDDIQVEEIESDDDED